MSSRPTATAVIRHRSIAWEPSMGAGNSKGEQPKRREYCPWRGRPQVAPDAPPQPGGGLSAGDAFEQTRLQRRQLGRFGLDAGVDAQLLPGKARHDMHMQM